MLTMSVKDIIKKSVLEGFNGTINSWDMLLSLVVAFLIGIFIIYVYRKTFTGVVYSKAFSLCILMLAMVTAMIIRTISSNIALSLGMVGALSIVRFRTAVKEPVDTGFMFWGISAGIMAGAGLYIPAIVASLGIGVFYFLTYLTGFRVSTRYLLVLKYESQIQDIINKKLEKIHRFKVRSKSVYNGIAELSLEVDIKNSIEKEPRKLKKLSKNQKQLMKKLDYNEIIDEFNNVDGVINASLVAYQNDFGD